MTTLLKDGAVCDSLAVCTRYARRMAVVVSLVLALAPATPSALAGSLPWWPAVESRAAGMGGAYTALAQGPLAPLCNPAGIITQSGVQGALSTAILPGGGAGLLLMGAAVVVAGGSAVAWNLVEDGPAQTMQGTLALALGPGMAAGGTLLYDTTADPPGIAFSAGILAMGDTWSLGASLLGLGSARSPEALLGFSLGVARAVTIGADLHFLETGAEIAVGGVATLGMVVLRWGEALGLGGLWQSGLGCGLPLFGQELDLAVLVRGADPSLVLVVEFEARIPAWW